MVIQTGKLYNLNAKAPSVLKDTWGIGPFWLEDIKKDQFTFQGRIRFIATEYQVQKFMDACNLKVVYPKPE